MLNELSFRVAGRDNLLCTFTRVNKGTKVVINPLRAHAEGRIENALYTIHAPKQQAAQLIERHFAKEYGPHKVIAEREAATTVEVALKLPSLAARGDPLHLALELLGPDAFFLPLVVQEGYIHCTIVSPSSEGTRAFIELTKKVNEALQPETFHLLHVGPWEATPSPSQAKDLTSRQQDVLRLAVAMGYYSQPRESTLDELAELLGVSKAAVHKTLAAAENKVIKEAMGAQ